jgi:hypothetical protein
MRRLREPQTPTLAYWGFQVGDGVGAWLQGIRAPLLAAVVWGIGSAEGEVAGAVPTRVVNSARFLGQLSCQVDHAAVAGCAA